MIRTHPANVTYRQADYWWHRGLLGENLPAFGSGRARAWTPQAWWRCEVMGLLIDAGLDVRPAARIAERMWISADALPYAWPERSTWKRDRVTLTLEVPPRPPDDGQGLWARPRLEQRVERTHDTPPPLPTGDAPLHA